MKFHLDEHVAPAVAVGLRNHGIDVTTTAEAGLLGAEDPEHIAYALAEERVVLTHDHDCLRHASEGTEHAGIVYCHQTKHSIGNLIRWLLLINECLSPEEMRSHVEFI